MIREPKLCYGCSEPVVISEALLDSDDDGRPIYFCSLACAEDCPRDELEDDSWDPIAEDRDD
jgi:hypothetical protein